MDGGMGPTGRSPGTRPEAASPAVDAGQHPALARPPVPEAFVAGLAGSPEAEDTVRACSIADFKEHNIEVFAHVGRLGEFRAKRDLLQRELDRAELELGKTFQTRVVEDESGKEPARGRPPRRRWLESWKEVADEVAYLMLFVATVVSVLYVSGMWVQDSGVFDAILKPHIGAAGSLKHPHLAQAASTEAGATFLGVRISALLLVGVAVSAGVFAPVGLYRRLRTDEEKFQYHRAATRTAKIGFGVWVACIALTEFCDKVLHLHPEAGGALFYTFSVIGLVTPFASIMAEASAGVSLKIAAEESRDRKKTFHEEPNPLYLQRKAAALALSAEVEALSDRIRGLELIDTNFETQAKAFGALCVARLKRLERRHRAKSEMMDVENIDPQGDE